MALQVYQTKAGKRYRASFKFGDDRPSLAGFRTQAEARAWIVDKRRELKAAQDQVAQQTPTAFSRLATTYLDWCQGRMQPGTVAQKSFVYRSFLAHLGQDVACQDLTRAHITEFIGAQREARGEKAANRDLRDLHALFVRANREGWFDGNPASRIDHYAEDEYVKYVPPAEDIDAVLMAAEPWEMELLQVYYHTAGRLSEVLKLTWDDVNFERRWVRLWTRKRRGGAREARLLPMNAVLYGVLSKKWDARDKASPLVFVNPRTGGSYSKVQPCIKHLMSRLCERAGVRHFTVHAIRHHVASILQDSRKATLRQLQVFLGHKRQTTTEGYLHGLEARVEEIGEILECRADEKAQKAAKR